MVASATEAFELIEATTEEQKLTVYDEYISQKADDEYEQFCITNEVEGSWEELENRAGVAEEIEAGFQAISEGIDGTEMRFALLTNKERLAQTAAGEYYQYVRSITWQPKPKI